MAERSQPIPTQNRTTPAQMPPVATVATAAGVLDRAHDAKVVALSRFGFASLESPEAAATMQRPARALDSVLLRLDCAPVGWSHARLLSPPEGHLGANAYLTKPLDVAEVLRVVDAMLHAREVSEAV